MIFKTKNSSVEHNSSSCLQQSKEKLSTHYNLFLSVTKEKPFSIMINRYFSFNECNTTKKKAFYIGQLTSIIAKTDVNESAVAFL